MPHVQPFSLKRSLNSVLLGLLSIRWLAVSLIFLMSCKSDEFYATVEKNCPSNGPCFSAISLIASGGDWRCNGHGGGFYRELYSFEILLPETPTSQNHYEFSQIRLKVDSPFKERAVVIPLTSGHLDVDQTLGTVVVDFGTSQGAFWANGTYPIKSRY
jgi:hypothetical protein